MKCKSSRQVQQGSCLQKEHKTAYEKQLCCVKVTSDFGNKFLAQACASTICAAKKSSFEIETSLHVRITLKHSLKSVNQNLQGFSCFILYGYYAGHRTSDKRVLSD